MTATPKIYTLIYVSACCYFNDATTLQMCSTKISDIEAAIRSYSYEDSLREIGYFQINVWENGRLVKSKDIRFWMN